MSAVSDTLNIHKNNVDSKYYLEGREGHRLPNTPPIVVCINSCPDRRARTAPLLSLELSTLHTIRAQLTQLNQ